MTGQAGTCPSCGAPIRFGGAESLVTVCSHCRSAVQRKGANLEALGKLPDLVATDTRLALGAAGAISGKAFTIVGHLQLGHLNERGEEDAVWDEWHLAFADGTWGWLAEAQGHLLFTRPLASAQVPRYGSLRAGKRIELTGAGSVAVDEVNEAKFVAAEGELPFRPHPGAKYRFADCTSDNGGFVTIDYGSEVDQPEVFAGRELTYTEAGLKGFESRAAQRHPEGHALRCPNCGGPLTVHIAATQSATCPSCGSLLDVTKEPARVLAQLQKRATPPLPLGARGKLGENQLEVIGWMQRSVKVDGIDYTWDEYLLHGEIGYRWLSESNGHWLYLSPIPAGKVAHVDEFTSAECDGRRFRHFQSGDARYGEIQGEFYWLIKTQQEVHTADFVAPPYLLSRELSGKEVNWSRGEHLDGAVLWRAFAQPGSPPRARGVGAAQPNPFSASLGTLWTIALVSLLALIVAAIALSSRRREVALNLQVPLTQAGVSLSEPFDLTGGPQAVTIRASAPVDQAWVGLDVALINDESGESDAAGFELSHYHGVDDGEAWSEGTREGTAVIGHVPDGRYLLRVEPQVENRQAAPPFARVEVETHAFLLGPFLLAALLILSWPALSSFRASAFERARWSESDHAP